MPTLQKIIIQDFRNISLAELSFSPRVNCICGDNGQGKTNLLDAIHYLSVTKSAFAVPDHLCTRHGADSFSIAGLFMMSDSSQSRFVVSVGKDGKIVKKDSKAYERLGEHIGKLPVVMVSPQDYALVSESGEERRRFVNSVLSQISRPYLEAVMKYNRILAQRNKILKEYRPDVALLAVLDQQMSAEATVIFEARKSFCNELSSAVSGYYEQLSGGSENVSITYRSDLYDAESLEEILLRGRERDLYLKYTGSGVQRDDFIFLMDSHPIRRCGSQGQQKSFLVALKLAQYDIMKSSCGCPPLLLLDDVFDKLDFHRISNLLKIVSSRDYGQIFITDTNRERLESIVKDITDDVCFFTAHNGEF